MPFAQIMMRRIEASMKRKQVLATLVTMIMVLSIAAAAMAQKTSKTAPEPDENNLMDLNSAPPEKLMTLPGIDMIAAKKIIAGRPYKKKDDLVTRKVLPQEAFNGITTRVTVKPAPAPAKKGE